MKKSRYSEFISGSGCLSVPLTSVGFEKDKETLLSVLRDFSLVSIRFSLSSHILFSISLNFPYHNRCPVIFIQTLEAAVSLIPPFCTCAHAASQKHSG